MLTNVAHKITRKRFTFNMLNDEFGIFAVRGPRGVPHSLSEALKE